MLQTSHRFHTKTEIGVPQGQENSIKIVQNKHGPAILENGTYGYV